MIWTANVLSTFWTVSPEPFQIPVLGQHSDTFSLSAFNTEATINSLDVNIVHHFGTPVLLPKDLTHVQGVDGKPVDEEVITPSTPKLSQS